MTRAEIEQTIAHARERMKEIGQDAEWRTHLVREGYYAGPPQEHAVWKDELQQQARELRSLGLETGPPTKWERDIGY